VSAPLVERIQEVVNGFIFRPEIPQQFVRVTGEIKALRRNQLLRRGVTPACIFLRKLIGRILHDHSVALRGNATPPRDRSAHTPRGRLRGPLPEEITQ